MSRELPHGYFLIDNLESPHDGDEADGRWGLYFGDPENGEFLGNLDDRDEVILLAWEHQKENKYQNLLKEYEEKKESGEDYVECPRCEGTQTVSAVLAENVEMAAMTDRWRYTEDFPCPLCCNYGPDTIDIDKAIEWLEDKVDG